MHLDAGDSASYPGTGTAWTDLSGSANNGTLTNGPSFSAANGGQIVFDGVNDFVDTNYTQPAVTEYTIEVWFKSYDNSNGGLGKMLVNNRGTGAGLSISVGISPLGGEIGKLWMGVDSTNIIIQRASTQTDFIDGTWRQAVGVFSQTTGSAITPNSFVLFANGQTITSSGSSVLQVGSRNSPAGPGLGGTHLMRAQAWNTYTSGFLAIARIYNRALSVAEILQNFDAQKARFGL